MAIVLITGVCGTGKTAYLVSELQKIAETGRTIFVDNIPSLKIPHYRAGKIADWQKGTWLHIDQYIRTSPAAVAPVKQDDSEEDENDGNENWLPNPDIKKDENGILSKTIFDSAGNHLCTVPYENHKGALLVIDECQRHFRPRPAGSAVPDYVAALEVHRHQSLDIWLVTQRPGLIDSNVRGLVNKHIAFRETPFGRYKYQWSEVGDIESKTSRDNAAKSRYKLPKHIYPLYKSAEIHNKVSHALPMSAKILILAVPLVLVFGYASYKLIASKTQPKSETEHKTTLGQVIPDSKALTASLTHKPPSHSVDDLPPGLTRFTPSADSAHPYKGFVISIVARLKSGNKDYYRFSLTSPDRQPFYLSSNDLQKSGYILSDRSDCSVTLTFNEFSSVSTCGSSLNDSSPMTLANQIPAKISEPETDTIPSRNYQSVVLADRTSGPVNR